MIKLFISDIDGTLTDGTVFYSKDGEVMKQFSHRDGRGFHLLHEKNIQCALITSEIQGINYERYKKFSRLGTVQHFIDSQNTKVQALNDLCSALNIGLNEVAMIGDDTNDSAALEIVGIAGCPADANKRVKQIDGIYIMSSNGGRGAVREFIDMLFDMEII